MMKILFVSQNYCPLVGGIETHARQLTQALGERHKVAVAAVNFTANKLPQRFGMLHNSTLAPGYQSHIDGRIPVHSLSPRPVDRIRLLPIAARIVPGLPRLTGYFPLERFGYPCYRSVFLPRLQRLLKGADLVHSLAGGYLGWTAQAAALSAGVPFVCTPFVHPCQWGDGPMDVAYYRRSDAVIGLVDTDSDYLVQIGVPASKIRTIGVSPELPPTVDGEGFRRRQGLVGAPMILYVGRMMPQKGASAVVEAAPLVWRQHPDARFVFVGPTSPESELWFRGSDPRILVLGRVSLQEKADALAACDIFCMPSLSEILPTVYLEAWSLGKPVVGGRAHGLPELVEGNGAGVAVGQNPAEVADALSRLLDDAALRQRFGESGRRLVEDRYSVTAVTRALEGVYEGLVQGVREQVCQD